MSKNERGDWKKGAALAAGLTGFAAGIGVAGITWDSHRRRTHRSIDLHPALVTFFELEQRSLGVTDPNIWAAVHRIHHSMTDASLYPQYQLHHAIKEADARGLAVPDSFGYLDPYVPSFSRAEVEKIGMVADTEVRKRLEDTYVEPNFGDKSDAELAQILNPTSPRYYYPDYSKHKGPYNQDDIARIMLTDPHSPALIPPVEKKVTVDGQTHARRGSQNGIRGVLKSNVFLYKTAAEMFGEHPNLKDKDLITGDEGTEPRARNAVIGGFVLPSLGVLAYRAMTGKGGFTPKDLAIAGAVGSAMNLGKIGGEIIGGNVVNSIGHAGKLDARDLLKATLKRDYLVVLKPDGTLATDTVYSGAIGKILSWLTFDEVGGQAFHHANPDAIKYTDKEGFQAWFDAPWGSFTSWLADSKIPLVTRGPGFEGLRPDVPHDGVLLIQQVRAEQYKRNQLALAA